MNICKITLRFSFTFNSAIYLETAEFLFDSVVLAQILATTCAIDGYDCFKTVGLSVIASIAEKIVWKPKSLAFTVIQVSKRFNNDFKID